MLTFADRGGGGWGVCEKLTFCWRMLTGGGVGGKYIMLNFSSKWIYILYTNFRFQDLQQQTIILSVLTQGRLPKWGLLFGWNLVVSGWSPSPSYQQLLSLGWVPQHFTRPKELLILCSNFHTILKRGGWGRVGGQESLNRREPSFLTNKFTPSPLSRTLSQISFFLVTPPLF